MIYQEIFCLFKGTRLLGVFNDKTKAIEKMNTYSDEFEYQVESWPLNQVGSKFSVMVEAVK